MGAEMRLDLLAEFCNLRQVKTFELSFPSGKIHHSKNYSRAEHFFIEMRAERATIIYNCLLVILAIFYEVKS